MDKVYRYTDDFKKIVFDFYKNKELNSKEMSIMLKNMFMFFATDYTEEKEHCSSLLNEKDTEDFKQMQAGFVQQFIDFVNLLYEQNKITDDNYNSLINKLK